MMADNIVKDYTQYFDINDYLNCYFKDPNVEPDVLKNLHKFWKRFGSKKNLSLLEFGGGPNISKLISACPYVEHIVFAEHTEAIRKAAENWAKQAPGAFDWKATFDFIVQQLEGGSQQDSDQRQADLRQKIKAFVPCDVKASSPLELPATLPDEYRPPYDVVLTSLCLEAVVESDEEYKKVVARLAQLVKPGGYMIMHGALEQSFYTVGKYKFYSYKLSKEIIVQSLEDAGFKDIETDIVVVDSSHLSTLCDTTGEFFVCGKKE